MLTSLLLSTANDSTSIVQNINRTFDNVLSNIKGASSYWDGLFLTNAASQIAAICVLFYLGYEMWPVILGRKSPDIIKLVRPLLLATVISSWSWVYLEFLSVKKDLTDEPKAMYMAVRNEMVGIEKRMDEKIETVDSITKDLFIMAATGKLQEQIEEDRRNGKGGRASETGGEGYSGGGEGGGIRGGGYDPDTEGMVFIDEDHSSSAFWDTTYALAVTGEYWILRFFEYLIEIIGTLILQCYLCGIIIISEIGVKILGMFGPILFALSIAERFRNYWAKWIEKFICLSLYPFLGYLIMGFMSFIIMHQMEIQEDMIKIDDYSNFQTFLSHSYQNFGVLINFMAALFVCSSCMKAVPELASMVFPGPSGRAAVEAGQFLTGMTMTIASTGTSMAAKTAGKILKTGTSAIGAGAGMAMGGIVAASGGIEHDSFGKQNPNTANKTVKKQNSLDSYAWYNPLRFFMGKFKQKPSVDDGEDFEYKRGNNSSKQNTQSKEGRYAPLNKNVRRGQHIKLDSWKSRNLGVYNVKQKVKHNTRTLKQGAFSLANFILADHNDMGEQQWAKAAGNVISSLKKSARSTLSIPAIFNYHYKKHAGNGTYQAINQWQKERSSDMVFVRRAGLGTYYYQTYGEEAQNLAKLTGEKVKYIKVGNQKVATFLLSKHTLQPVIHRLNEMGLSVNVINVKGKSVYYKEDITFEKQDYINKIKDIIKQNGGGIKFNNPITGFLTEMTGDGYGRRSKIANRTIDVLGITTDVYGAAFAIVQDEKGEKQNIYLDRIITEDIKRLQETIDGWRNKDDKGKSDFTVIHPKSENDLDNAFDEYGFANRESRDYANAANNPEEENKTDSSIQNNDNTIEENQTQKDDKVQDPLQQLKQEWAWVNTTPLGEWRKTSGKAAGFIGGSALLLMRSNKYGRAAVGAANRVSSFFGWNDKTQADIHKDLRAGLEYRWHFNMTIKDNVDFRKRHRGLPVSFTLKRSKEQVIRRGRGIYFNGVDFRNRTGFQKVANTGWRFTKWTVKAAFKTGAYALGVATGQRPLINISAVGAWGFKKSYNGIRWMTRQTTARNAVIAWKREDKHNYVIVNRSGLQGNRFQTYGEDAVAIARILHKERDLRVLHIGQGNSFSSGGFFDKNAVPSLTLTKDDLSRLKAVLDRRGLTMDVINTRGRSMLKRNSELATALGIHNATASNGAGNPSTPNDPNVRTTNNQGSNNPQDHNIRQNQQSSSPTDPDVSDTTNDPTDPNTQGTSNGTTSPSSPEPSSSQTTPNPTNSAAADVHSASGKTNDPIVLDYSSKDAIVKNKTFEIKDVFGKTIYLVTGETLQSCLENMVRQGYSLASLDLSKADLRDANLKGADLRDANLTEANLRGARLQKASLRNADLTKANLRVAKLGKANLSKAQLSYADLRDADLKKADTSHSIFDNADLRGTIFDKRSDNPNKPS